MDTKTKQQTNNQTNVTPNKKFYAFLFTLNNDVSYPAICKQTGDGKIVYYVDIDMVESLLTSVKNIQRNSESFFNIVLQNTHNSLLYLNSYQLLNKYTFFDKDTLEFIQHYPRTYIFVDIDSVINIINNQSILIFNNITDYQHSNIAKSLVFRLDVIKKNMEKQLNYTEKQNIDNEVGMYDVFVKSLDINHHCSASCKNKENIDALNESAEESRYDNYLFSTKTEISTHDTDITEMLAHILSELSLPDNVKVNIIK